MLKTVLTGLVAYTLFFVVNSGSASANTLDIPTSNVEDSVAVQLAVVVDDVQVEELEEIVEEEPAEPAEKVHTIVENETLTDIAKQYDTTWKRLYDKNEAIETPDIINPGEEIVIPDEDEEIEPRELPEPPAPAPVQAVATTAAPRPAATAPAPQPRGSSAGNGYVYGYCTWHVKQMRPDLPNNLGNANTWSARAAAQGFATGSKPRVGAVAQALTGYMHVAYVTAVNGDGTVTVSEMNFNGWGVVSSRTAPASAFTYIY